MLKPHLWRMVGAASVAALALGAALVSPTSQSKMEQGKTEAFAFHELAVSRTLAAAGFGRDAVSVILRDVVAPAQDQREWSPQNGLVPGALFDANLHCVRQARETHQAVLSRAARYLAERKALCLAELKAGRKGRALVALGGFLHATHAFLAHSNWVDLPDAEREAALAVLFGSSAPPPAELRIAAIASNGGSPRNDPYGVDEFDKSGPNASRDAAAPSLRDATKSKYLAVLDACTEVGRRAIELIEKSDDSAAYLWADLRAYRSEEGVVPGELEAFARQKGLEDAAFASILVAPDEKVTVTNPFEAPLAVTNVATSETRTIEGHGTLVLGAKEETLAITGVGVGSAILQVSYVAERPRSEAITVGTVMPIGEAQIPLIGAATPLLVVDCNAPRGTSVELQVTDDKRKTTSVPAQGLVIVTTDDGRLRQSVLRFVHVNVSPATIRSASIVLTDPAGIEISRKNVRLKDGSIKVSLQPTEGPPGSSATVVIEGKAFRQAMALDRPVFTGSDLVFRVDYSRSGGASGPRIVPFPESGTVRFEVVRSSTPGVFQLIVVPVLRSSLFSETTCGGGRVRIGGADVPISPHSRRSVPGCPYCGATPLRLGGSRPERCPGSTSVVGGMVELIPAHVWGRERRCRLCRT